MNRRFYDQDPTVAQAVSLLLMFPPELQTVIAKAFAAIAERDFNMLEIMKEFRSLGTAKVLALHMSKQKKRAYDQDPLVHQAMNYLMLMESRSRQRIAERILVLVGHIQEYLTNCKTFNVAPSTQTVEKIADVYVQFGTEHVKEFLAALKRRMEEGVPEAPVPTPETSPAETPPDSAAKGPGENIKDEGGMKIKGFID